MGGGRRREKKRAGEEEEGQGGERCLRRALVLEVRRERQADREEREGGTRLPSGGRQPSISPPWPPTTATLAGTRTGLG